jgi:hypothetical protein
VIAWAATSAALVLGLVLVTLFAPGAVSHWRTLTHAFIAAPLALVALTVLASIG